MVSFYRALLNCLHDPAVRDGEWQQLEAEPAWEGNDSCRGFLAFVWRADSLPAVLAVVNFRETQGQCRLTLPFASESMDFDMPGFGCHVFRVTTASEWSRLGNLL